MFVWHFASYLLSLWITIAWKCHEYLVKIPWKLQNKFHGCIHGHEFSMKIEPFHLMTHVFSMKTWPETFHGPWKHGQDFHEPWNCHEKLSLLISWAMKTWHETFKGHEFAINLIKEYFMDHEKLVIALPLAMKMDGAVVLTKKLKHCVSACRFMAHSL